MIHDYMKPLMHYVCIALLVVLGYFVAASLLDHAHTYSGPQVVVAQPTPNAVGRVADGIADAAKNVALSAALRGEAVQLSAAQQTIANAVSAYTGASARMAGALAAGLTQGPPKRQVVTVSTVAGKQATFTVPTPGPSDDNIKRDMKEVLSTTTVNANVDTHVTVGWENKPMSPISAAYTSDGGSGAAWTIHKAPALSLNLLALVNKGKPEVGFNFEHILKNTSAGIGVGAAYNSGTRKIDPLVTVQIHF